MPATAAIDLSSTSATGQKRRSNDQHTDATPAATAPKVVKLFKPYLLDDDNDDAAAGVEATVAVKSSGCQSNANADDENRSTQQQQQQPLEEAPSSTKDTDTVEGLPSLDGEKSSNTRFNNSDGTPITFFPCAPVSPALSATDSLNLSLTADSPDSATSLSSSSSSYQRDNETRRVATNEAVAASTLSKPTANTTTSSLIRVQAGYGSPVSGYGSATSSRSASSVSEDSMLIDVAADSPASVASMSSAAGEAIAVQQVGAGAVATATRSGKGASSDENEEEEEEETDDEDDDDDNEDEEQQSASSSMMDVHVESKICSATSKGQHVQRWLMHDEHDVRAFSV